MVVLFRRSMLEVKWSPAGSFVTRMFSFVLGNQALSSQNLYSGWNLWCCGEVCGAERHEDTTGLSTRSSVL